VRRLCYYCRQPMKRSGTKEPRSMTWDHLMPKCRGGGGGDNRVRCCRKCNNEKGNMTEPEYRQFLLEH